MTPDEIRQAYEQAEKAVSGLQRQSAQLTQTFGQISSILSTTKPYYVQLAAESGNNQVIIPILESGKAAVVEIGKSLADLQQQYTPPTVQAQTISLSASFFGSNTAATGSLVPLMSSGNFNIEAIPIPEFSKERTLPERFQQLDPALGKVCAQIWESLYGTISDPERSALFMLRQTWDHLFQHLAPDESVRKSQFWKQKPEPKPNMVTREERFNFAVATHVKDPLKQGLLSAACKQMIDLYQELNRAHERGDLDALKARRALNSLYAWLTQWAEALGI